MHCIDRLREHPLRVVTCQILPQDTHHVAHKKGFTTPHRREDAFALAYVRPGMRKVNQALGRLVRAPGHTARVLLHCRRFADETYKNLLSSEYGDPEVLINDESFQQWVKKS